MKTTLASNRPLADRSGFTLAEVLVSSVLIVVIMGLLLTTVSQTQKVWSGTTSKVAQFQAARTSFESMTRRLAQATLNTYWRAWDGASATDRDNFYFTRKADLQFLTGPSDVIFKNPALTDVDGDISEVFPTHSMFFFGPLGYTEEAPLTNDKNPMGAKLRFRMTDSLLSATGYFVEFGDEKKPEFLEKLDHPPKYRYRLKELNVPSEMVTVMRQPSIADVVKMVNAGTINLRQLTEQFILDQDENLNSTAYYPGLVDSRTRSILSTFKRPSWMKVALFRETVERSASKPVSNFRFTRNMADNIIALVVLPKLAERDRGSLTGTGGTPDPENIGELAPEYAFDSWRKVAPSAASSGNDADDDNLLKEKKFPPRDCLLPPIIQVTMVAIDEPSAERMDLQPGGLPKWTDGLFKKVKSEKDYFRDLAELEKRLQEDPARPAYRVFTNDVVIRSSKWSTAN